MGNKVDYLIDNNRDKHGKKMFGKEVVSFDTVVQKVGLIIVSNKQYFHEIHEQIKRANEHIKVVCIQEYLYCSKGLEQCIR